MKHNLKRTITVSLRLQKHSVSHRFFSDPPTMENQSRYMVMSSTEATLRVV